MVRLPYSLIIGLGGLVTAGLLAVPFGLYSSLRPGGWIDKASRILVVATQSLPTFWVGLILIWLFAVKTQLLKPFTGNLFERLILPTALVTLYSLGALTRVYRRELQLAIDQPFFTVAIAKGLSRRNAVFRHAGRPALFGLLAAFTPECAWIVGGTAVVEVVFAVPGISEFLVESIRFRDYFVLQAYIVVIGIWMLGIHFVAGLLRQMLDPRSS